MTTAPNFNAIFDFDGVLGDSAPLIVEVLGHTLRRRRGLAFSEADLRRAVGPPFREALGRLYADSGIATDADDIDRILEEFRAAYGPRVVEETLMFDGMRQAVIEIAERAQLAICSSKPRPLVEGLLAAWRVDDVFVDVEAPLPGAHESKVDGLARLLARLEAVPSSTALIGDTIFDAQAASAHDVPFVGVAWGVGDVAELRASGAVAIAATPADLVGIIGERAR